MKASIITFLLLLLTTSIFAQQHLTIFYFGASSCPPCNRPEVIQSINELKAKFDSVYTEYKTKFVIVVFDEQIKQGLKFIDKYSHWDEVSIGSRYRNELALAYLNKANMPGLPHILIYKTTFKDVGYGVEIIKTRKLVKEVLGGSNIVTWVNSGMKLK